MKITSINARLVRLPAIEPLANGPVPAGTMRDVVLLRVGTDHGPEGIGFTCFPGYYAGGMSAALKTAVEYLGSLVVGEDPVKTEAIHAKLAATVSYAGPGGVATLALAALDIALWDIKGKACGEPLASLVGGRRSRVPAYASGVLQRNYPLKHIVTAAEHLAASGFRQIKMQLGLGGRVEDEIERVRQVRAVIGERIDLMVDVNQRWDVKQAIAIGRRLEEFHLSWLEDVTAFDDYAGIARVTEALSTPIAGGEYVFGTVPFRQMLEARSLDIVMIDLLRVGGITQWIKVAGMAEAFNIPVVSHIMPEISLHLVAGVANGMTVEYIPWVARLFKEVPQFEKGEVVVPQRPGLGLEFDEEVVARHLVV
ncbi:MAG TPA: mandelate racemase/muconate lactonizing enzyme family protein [Burkholderiales bacterium]